MDFLAYVHEAGLVFVIISSLSLPTILLHSSDAPEFIFTKIIWLLMIDLSYINLIGSFNDRD